MFLQVPFRSERHSTGLASERSLKVMNIHVQPQLTGLGEDLVANATHGPTVFENGDIGRRGSGRGGQKFGPLLVERIGGGGRENGHGSLL